MATTIGVVALLFGFCTGWSGNQAYIRSQFESMFEDFAEDTEVPVEETGMEEYEPVFDVPQNSELSVIDLSAESAPEVAVVEVP